MEWMEQPNLLQLLDVPVYNDSPAAEPALHEGEDFVFSMPSLDVVKPEPDTQEPVSVDEFLKNLLKAPQDQPTQGNTEVATSPAPSSPEAQVAPEISFTEEDAPSLEAVLECQFLQSPLSPDDVESVLSSACSPLPSTPLPSSPSSSTVDTTCLYSDDGSLSLSSSDLYKVVENREKTRGTPYSRPQKSPKASGKSKGRKQTASISPSPSELELEMMSKKDRKKLQNKNAAIRYRMKKKVESDQKKVEVDDLESTNSELHDKVEELTREIKYMKDLINDVRKAQGLPSLV